MHRVFTDNTHVPKGYRVCSYRVGEAAGDMRKRRYIARLWESELVNYLASQERLRGDLTVVHRNERIPSWSWASSSLPI